MQNPLREVKSDRRERDGWNCRKLLTYEKERSQRHNRFFSLCGVMFVDTPGDELHDFLENDLRASDYIFHIPNTDKPSPISGKIGLLMPETDLRAGEVVKERMKKLCHARKWQVEIGLATYPDDSTSIGELLKKAFGAVLPREIGDNATVVE